MRPGWILFAALAVAAPAQAITDSSKPPRDSDGRPARQVRATVSPTTGTPSTRFVVTFRARNEAHGKVRYVVEATGERGDGVCDDATVRFRHADRRDLVHVRVQNRRITPEGLCPGHFDGVVLLEDRRGGLNRSKQVGSFSFDVEAQPAPTPRSAPPSG